MRGEGDCGGLHRAEAAWCHLRDTRKLALNPSEAREAEEGDNSAAPRCSQPGWCLPACKGCSSGSWVSAAHLNQTCSQVKSGSLENCDKQPQQSNEMKSVRGWGPQLWAVVPKERYGCSMASLLPAGSLGSLPLGRPHYLCFLLIQGIFFLQSWHPEVERPFCPLPTSIRRVASSPSWAGTGLCDPSPSSHLPQPCQPQCCGCQLG